MQGTATGVTSLVSAQWPLLLKPCSPMLASLPLLVLERCRAPNTLYAPALKLHSECPEADRGCYFRAVALAAEAVLADAGQPAAAGAGALPSPKQSVRTSSKATFRVLQG